MKARLAKVTIPDLPAKLDGFLHLYRRTPSASSGKSPSKQLLGYQLQLIIVLLTMAESDGPAPQDPLPVDRRMELKSAKFIRNYGRERRC